MSTRSLIAIALFTGLTLPASAAGAIPGKVRNSTSNQPAVGDDVILLRFGNGMEEEARTKTDAQGAFTFKEVSAGAQYMVRVIHQGVNYDQTVIGTAPLAIQVFDTVDKIPGLSGSMGIARVESDGKILTVTEMYAISNQSLPPVTQSRPRNFEFLLPEKAALDSVQARRGSGVWVKTRSAPVNGQPRLYAIDFPLRPGDTLIKFVYHLPYAGPTSFHLRLPYPIRKFAVMHPRSISFKAARPETFSNPGMLGQLQVEEAVAQPVVGDVPPFQVSGDGMAQPRGAAASANPAPAPAPALPAASSPPATAAASQNPAPRIEAGAADAPEPQARSWLVALAIAAVLTGAALLFWRTRKAPRRPTASPNGGTPPLLEALKEELFQLEVDRAGGSISPDEYAATRQALNVTMQRAMGKRTATGK